MILVIDYDNTRQDILLADESTVRRFDAGPGAGFQSLEQVIESVRNEGHERADGIAVVLPLEAGEGAEEEEAEEVRRDMSWSTVRAAVSMANGLAFAWGVPAVRISGEGEDDDDLVGEASDRLRKADPDSRVSATYDGEPNITKPKKG
ncbi:MAG: hypothetical protein U9Q03_00050 [Patescibacteria group bacterium]|nr:hypothetical protein [Patescibacteria group bacterium]